MNRKQLHRWTAWLLPLIALRAFIPAGFMLETGVHGLALAFCSGMASVGGQQAGEPRHATHHADDAAGVVSHDNAPCPYSLAASAGPQTIPSPAVAPLAPSDETVEFVSLLGVANGPSRADRIRGPPLYS